MSTIKYSSISIRDSDSSSPCEKKSWSRKRLLWQRSRQRVSCREIQIQIFEKRDHTLFRYFPPYALRTVSDTWSGISHSALVRLIGLKLFPFSSHSCCFKRNLRAVIFSSVSNWMPRTCSSSITRHRCFLRTALKRTRPADRGVKWTPLRSSLALGRLSCDVRIFSESSLCRVKLKCACFDKTDFKSCVILSDWVHFFSWTATPFKIAVVRWHPWK